MSGGEGDAVAADVEVGDIVFGEVDGEAAAGGLAFEVVGEADCGWIVEQEVGGGLGVEESQEAESESCAGLGECHCRSIWLYIFCYNTTIASGVC